MERKDALKILDQVRTVYVVLSPGAVKATKGSVRSLINSPDWPGFNLTKIDNCAVLKKETEQ